MQSLIGFISDAHGNSPAFDRAIALLQAQGAERLYFLGDAIGYVPSTGVLDSLSRLGDRVKCIRGNHETMFLEGPIDPAKERVYQLEVLRPDMTSRQVEMISSWPAWRREVVDGLKLFLVHGSPTDPTYGYVYPDTDLSDFTPNADWVFLGNTHYPFIRKHSGTNFVNIGSCGLPRDDGRYGSVALLDTKERSVQILRFDITAESQLVLEQFSTVHESVRNVYQRRRPVVIGDFL